MLGEELLLRRVCQVRMSTAHREGQLAYRLSERALRGRAPPLCGPDADQPRVHLLEAALQRSDRGPALLGSGLSGESGSGQKQGALVHSASVASDAARR